MLGHSDLKTTKGYLHDTADHINRMGRQIDGLGEEKSEEQNIADVAG
jgi:hypothetical protein